MDDTILLMLPTNKSPSRGLIRPKKKVYKRVVKKQSEPVVKTPKKSAGKAVKTPKKAKTVKAKAKEVVDFDIEFEEDDISNAESDANLDNELDDMLMKARNVLGHDYSGQPMRNQLTSLNYDYDDEDEEPEPEPEPVKKTPVKRKTVKKTAVKKTGVKKGPGRPRKTPKKEPIPRNGIQDTPTDVDDVIEVVYAMPLLFKKIIAFFKSLAAAEVQIIFRPIEIIMYAQDHLKKSRIRVRIDATKLHHYYCRNVVDIGVNCKDMELILNKVDKDYTSIIVLSAEGSTQKSITMILENEMQIDEIHTVGLIGQYEHIEDEAEFMDENYTIQFKYPSKYFRKIIADIKTMSSRMCITQETSDDQLEIGYRSKNKKIRSKHTARDPSRISLTSKLRPGETFRVDVKVDYIKPISSAQIADEIWLLVDENKRIMTKALIDDETIEIKTLTEIIDGRPDDE